MRTLAVQERCAVLTSCQRISAQWFSAWLRGPWAHTALLAVKPELCAGLDRVTIVKNAAKVQWLHSARLAFTLSPLPTYPHRTKQKHTVCHLVRFTKSAYSTSTNTKVFRCRIPGYFHNQVGEKMTFISGLLRAQFVIKMLLVDDVFAAIKKNVFRCGTLPPIYSHPLHRLPPHLLKRGCNLCATFSSHCSHKTIKMMKHYKQQDGSTSRTKTTKVDCINKQTVNVCYAAMSIQSVLTLPCISHHII